MNTATDTIACPNCGGEMQVGVMPTENESSIMVHGICQACDCHITNKFTVDAAWTQHHVLQNHDWVMRQFRESVARHFFVAAQGK